LITVVNRHLDVVDGGLDELYFRLASLSGFRKPRR